MTLAREERTDNFKLALRTLLEAVSDSALDEVSFDPNAYPDILETTWEELQGLELIEPLPGRKYLLTGRGWTAALITTDTRTEPWFTSRLHKLFGAMKALVKGRKELTIVPMRVLVESTGLPEGWIFNIIEGKYLEEVSKRRGASWVKPGRVLLIPTSFGIEPTDLNTLLQDEMLKKVEDLEAELEATREDLGRYQCPYCSAELSSAGGYPIDEHTDGYFETFGCGYSLQDGYPTSLCPKDPKFPKLEDFELRIEQTTSGEWICYAIGKTPKAKLVSIGFCPGRTEEEARQRVARRYDYLAGNTRDPMASLG